VTAVRASEKTNVQVPTDSHRDSAGTLGIEIGWILSGRLNKAERQAVEAARTGMLQHMEERFPEFHWSMPLVERRQLRYNIREEPSKLLDYAIEERDARHWDFAFLLTSSDLVTYYRPYAFGTSSRSVSVAILSTSRIDPISSAQQVGEEERKRILSERLLTLALHLFGHLNGLEHEEDHDSVMFELQSVQDLDGMSRISEEAIAFLQSALMDVADPRLEESQHRPGKLGFYLRVVWQNRKDILSAVRQAEPWRLPFHLGRLTTAALSALLILLMTAEVWDLGMSQPAWLVVSLSVVTLLVMTTYLLKRQRLLVRRGTHRFTEQTAVTNIAVATSVLLGLATTYVGLLLLTLVVSRAIYPKPLVLEWAASLQRDVRASNYACMAGFVASLGIAIGALGASFEEHQYFRHIAYIDEET
jgi:predicted Zn-dependent protease